MSLLPLRLTLFSSKKQVAKREQLAALLNDVESFLGERRGPEDLLVPDFELKSFQEKPGPTVTAWLDGPRHSVLVVLVDDALLEDKELLGWLRQAAKHMNGQPAERHALLAVPLGVRAGESWIREHPLGEFQALPWEKLHVEQSPRLSLLAQRVLNLCVRTLGGGLPGRSSCKLRVFISHAKLDGFYLAQSVRRFIHELPWLEKFYDADDIEVGMGWKRQLRQGVERSIMLVLRTDAYDQRPWCREELRLAEQMSLPRVIVDARTRLASPPSLLDFESGPYLRVPDGDLSRILFALLHTALTVMCFRRRVYEMERRKLLSGDSSLRLLPFAPSLRSFYWTRTEIKKLEENEGSDENETGKNASGEEASGEKTSEDEEKGKSWLLIYPDPPLGESALDSASLLVKGVRATLCTPSQVLLDKPDFEKLFALETES